MILESRIKDKRKWFTVILIILGWLISYPILKFGIQARVEEELNERLFVGRYLTIVIVSIVYFVLKYNIRFIAFDDRQQKLILMLQNKLGFSKRFAFDYDAITYSEYDIRSYSSIEITQRGKKKKRIYRRDFSDEVYSQLIKKLQLISQIKQRNS